MLIPPLTSRQQLCSLKDWKLAGLELEGKVIGNGGRERLKTKNIIVFIFIGQMKEEGGHSWFRRW